MIVRLPPTREREIREHRAAIEAMRAAPTGDNLEKLLRSAAALVDEYERLLMIDARAAALLMLMSGDLA